MQKLTLFYLEHCPYCRNARRALEALRAENADYARVEIEPVEESLEPARADRYDYYRVPSVFLGEEKLYECSPADGYEDILSRLRAALDRALQA